MKFVLFSLLLLVAVNIAQAQKENNVWLGGQSSGIDFNSGTPVVFSRGNTQQIWRTNASICDHQGNLLIYTNGYRVFNKNFQVMQNGDNLNIGDYVTFGYDELSVSDGAAIVPIPNDSNRYYVFHMDLNYVDFQAFTNVLMPTHLFYCIVDMSLAGGLGGIVSGQKDVVILNDTLTSCGFKVVKHANGRDYWLLCHEAGSNRYYRFLIDPYGIHGPYTQNVGRTLDKLNALWFSTLHFNETATQAAQLINDSTRIALMDFDRCSGLFSNVREFAASDTNYQTDGGAFSPSGRYFYATVGLNYIWQFDVSASDIFASRKLIAVYDGVLNPFPTDFYQLRLAPDGKIYVHSYAFNHSLHVINHPDSLGSACGFVGNSLQLNPPGWDWNGFPNIINYSLGPLYGSGCDTLTAVPNLATPAPAVTVYPNPFTDAFELNVTGLAADASVKIDARIYDVLGRCVYRSFLSPHNGAASASVSLSGVAPGVYVLSITAGSRRVAQRIVCLDR